MNAIPARLTTRHLLRRDIAKAADEALANLVRLILCGYHDAAWRIAVALLSPGPWRISSRSHLTYAIWWFLLWLERRLDRKRPASLDEESEAARAAIACFRPPPTLDADTSQVAALLTDPEPSRTAWSAAELEATLSAVRPGDTGIPFVRFSNDATAALRLRTTSEGQLEPVNHAAIADAVEQGWRIAFPKTYALHAMDSAWSAAELDLREGRQSEAVARVGRLLGDASLSERDRFHLRLERAFEVPFADLLPQRVLAPALGLTDDGVDAYLDAFSRRSPQTILDEAPRPWKKVLREYAKRIEEDGIGKEDLVNAVTYTGPVCEALLKRARTGRVLNSGCRDQDLADLETRLGTQLPPSYREFLLASNGLVVHTLVSLLPAEQVDWFAALDRYSSIEGWIDSCPDEASDEQYAIYGADQDCVHMRPRHLRTALQVSTTADGDVLLLIPEVRFGAEWEAWFLGSKNPGAYRYRSFRDMMEQAVLADEN